MKHFIKFVPSCITVLLLSGCGGGGGGSSSGTDTATVGTTTTSTTAPISTAPTVAPSSNFSTPPTTPTY